VQASKPSNRLSRTCRTTATPETILVKDFASGLDTSPQPQVTTSQASQTSYLNGVHHRSSSQVTSHYCRIITPQFRHSVRGNPNDVLLGKTYVAGLYRQSMAGFQEGEPRVEGSGKRIPVKLKFFETRRIRDEAWWRLPRHLYHETQDAFGHRDRFPFAFTRVRSPQMSFEFAAW